MLECTTLGVDATSGESLTLEGMTIRNGEQGIDATGDLVLEDVILTGLGDGTQDGAALRLVGGTLVCTDGTAEYCESDVGTIYLDASTASLYEVDLRYSTATSGGGIYALDTDLELYDAAFLKNEVEGDGGALFQSGGSLDATDSGFVACTAEEDGACATWRRWRPSWATPPSSSVWPGATGEASTPTERR